MTANETQSFGVSHKKAEADDAGQRLDNYLARGLKGVPSSMI